MPPLPQPGRRAAASARARPGAEAEAAREQSHAAANCGVNADVAIAIVKAEAVKEVLFVDQEVARAVAGFLRAHRAGEAIPQPESVALTSLDVGV